MAIFKKFIGSGGNLSRKPSSTTSNEPNTRNTDNVVNEKEFWTDVSSLCWSPYKVLRRDMLRLVLFLEQGNRLLYDTDTVVSINDRIILNAQRTPCGQFQLQRKSEDTSQIAKMVFGTLTTSMKADSLKVHSLLNKDSIMLSRVFSIPKVDNKAPSSNDFTRCFASSVSSDSDSQSHYSTICSLGTISRDELKGLLRTNNAVDPPECFTRIRNTSLQLDADDAITPDDFRAFSPNRLSRLRRRQMSLKGLCDEGMCPLYNSRSRISSTSSINERHGNDENRQYGLALIFPSEEKEFLFQHILQIEKEILKLIIEIHKAVLFKKEFFNIAYEGWCKFSSSICLFHNALRLKTPVWLSLTNPQLQESTANEFCKTLVRLVDKLNTKNTKFFLSTLISSVLMNHLAWVASVTPPDHCSYDRSLLLGTSVIDSRRNPYNAMMAQFLELSGGVGMGNRFAKTVIFGDNPKLISEILYVLSYFIRCSSVESRKNEAMTPDSLSPIKSLAESDSFMEDDSLSKSISNSESLFSSENHPPMFNAFNTKIVMSQSHPNNTTTQIQPNLLRPSTEMFQQPHEESDSSSNEAPPLKTRVMAFPRRANSNCSNLAYNLRHRMLHRQDSLPHQKHYELVMVDVGHLLSNNNNNYNNNEMISKTPSEFLSGSPKRPYPPPTSLDIPRNHGHSGTKSTDFGRSLLAGVCTAYSNHFVLSGIDKRYANLEETLTAIYEDVKHPRGGFCSNSLSSLLSPGSQPSISNANPLNYPTSPFLVPQNSAGTFLPHLVTPSSVDSQKSSQSDNNLENMSLNLANKNDAYLKAVVVAADCSNYTVKIVSSENCHIEEVQVASPSEAVASMLEEFVALYRQGCNSTFLISFLEDRLGSILAKSNVLVRLVNSSDEQTFGAQKVETSNLIKPVKASETSFTGINVNDSMQIGSKISPFKNLSEETFYEENFSKNSFSNLNENEVEKSGENFAINNNILSKKDVISMEHVSSILGCDCSDLRLILNVASVYSPLILSSAI